MRLFTVYHNLPEGYECTCVSDVFPAWRVRIMRIDGGCVCDFFKLVDDEWRIVPKTAIPEAQYQMMLRSDAWETGGFFECRRGNGKG